MEAAYYISSVSRAKGGDAKTLLKLARGHWGAIENGLHHVRDTTFNEDRCTIFRGDAAENLAALRNTALNWLRTHKIEKIASKIRSFLRNSQRLFTMMGILN